MLMVLNRLCAGTAVVLLLSAGLATPLLSCSAPHLDLRFAFSSFSLLLTNLKEAGEDSKATELSML
jgi:hypothetical protein